MGFRCLDGRRRAVTGERVRSGNSAIDTARVGGKVVFEQSLTQLEDKRFMMMQEQLRTHATVGTYYCMNCWIVAIPNWNKNRLIKTILKSLCSHSGLINAFKKGPHSIGGAISST